MKPWPAISIPPISQTLPALRLKPTWGEKVESHNFTCYVCGITPYDATHLGHAATYLTFDLIIRYQFLSGKKINFIENVTDVDDPLLERAKRDGIDWNLLAESQINLFENDMTALRVIPPNLFLSVSETVDLVIEGITKLKEKNRIYELDGDIYFDISEFLEELPININEAIKIFGERGGDPERLGKRNSLDPLLWRANLPSEPGWESPFGLGRPGWHIECSVIALHGGSNKNEIGSTLDLQGGGRDLIFPHHFMSKVIAESISGRPFANEYVHTGMLGLDGEKMSKSRGNLIFVHKLIEQGNDPMVIRYALMKEHYSKDWMWSQEHLEKATEEVLKIRTALSKIEVAKTDQVINQMAIALSDNLNTPKALSLLLEWSEATLNGEIGGKVGSISRFLDSALGLAL